LPFRTAHEVAALIVRDCVEAKQKSIGERTLNQLKERNPLFEADIFDALKPEACVAARNLLGGPAKDEVLRQINVLREIIA
jgi:argininosuccinate lyase